MMSSKRLPQGYDVFISFRGDDTRMGFTSHLYDALIRNNIKAYKDDKALEIGKLISAELLEAIETSRFAILVLSSSYATSTWCLEEIAKVVGCMDSGKMNVIPIFYHVTPFDVRHQSNCFEQGFTNHEADPEIPSQKVETWRAAFTRIGNISGLHVTQHRNESEVISEVVRRILKDIHDTLPIDLSKGLVGIELRANEVKRLLRVDSCEVLFLGICGISGIGKTTLAEFVYNEIRNKFDGSSFIENIKDLSKQNDSTDLCMLQQKLLDEISNDKSIRVQSVNHGKTLLGTKLRGLKVLIVLDDVNHLDQLTYLAGGHEWFGPGTRIIVTTTNTDLLNPYKINEIYRCEEMKGDEALRLFCDSAFEQDHPAHGYEKLCDDIVKLACGLPLALNTYGKILRGKEKNYWKDTLKKLGEYPAEEVLGRLGVVYARLDQNQQKALMYVACFLKGRDKDLVKNILRNIGLFSECGITDLVNKFLISINLEDCVWMHDLLQQMCWEILRRRSNKNDGEHIAIKSHQDIRNVLSSEHKGAQNVEIINQEPYNDGMEDKPIDPACFSKMVKLKFLRISSLHFSDGLNYLSNDLRVLEWYGCSLESLPSSFGPKHIFVLEMCNSQLRTLWENNVVLSNLRSINLSFSKYLIKIPDLTSALNLEKLILEGCTNLTDLHESVLVQKRLRYMNLKGCTRLRRLGGRTMELDALEALYLSNCSNLEYIPEFGVNMKLLEHLYVDGTRIKKLPDSLGEMYDLRRLNASGTSIEELPSFIHRLKKLRLVCVNRCPLSFKTRSSLFANMDASLSSIRDLDLSYCNLAFVPVGIGLLNRLINLDLSGNDFASLPPSISLLSNLRLLLLNDCKNLQSLAKLSIVNEDTLYGLQIRFIYYISRGGVQVSKFDTTSNCSSPTVSCLNCPKLAEDENGSYLAEKILSNYLQLRTNYWITPEAVFEIVGAGSEIPPGFKLLGSDDLILEGPWVGVGICAVVCGQHVDASLEAKYVVTAHICVGEKHWKISVPVNFLVAGLKNQLVFYWTVTDDLQRVVGSSQKHLCRFWFSVDPGDGKLQVTKFGVRFIRSEDILQLKLHESCTSLALYHAFRTTLPLPADLQFFPAFDTFTNQSFNHDLASRIRKFILDNSKQQNSLDGFQKIIKFLHEVNQEVLSECREEWRHEHIFPLIYDYCRISHGMSELFNDFLRFLRDVSDTWLSLKLALVQIVVKFKEADYPYEEMRQQLNDLEAAKTVRLTANFVISFGHICRQIVAFLAHLDGVIKGNTQFKSVKVLSKVSRTISVCVFSMVATYVGDDKLLQDMEVIKWNDMWLSMKNCWSHNRGHYLKSRFDRELQIWDFDVHAILLQDLKNKMTWSSVTKGIEKEMMIAIDKLEKKMNNMSKTIEDLSSHAHTCSHDSMEASIILNQLIVDGTLEVTKFGVCFGQDADILQLKRFEDPLREAVTNLFRTTAFLPASLQWYIRASKANAKITIRQRGLLKHTSRVIKSNVKSILERIKQDTFSDILDIIRCFYVNVINVEFHQPSPHEMLRTCQNKICYGKATLCCNLNFFLRDISMTWESVSLSLEQILFKGRAGDYTYDEMLQQLNDLKAVERIGSFGDFIASFEYLCDNVVFFLRIMNSVIYCDNKFETPALLLSFNMVIYRKKLKWMKSLKGYGQVLSRTIIGIFSIVATCMGDFELLQEMENMASNSTLLIYLIQCFSRKIGKWFDERGCIKKTSYGEELRIWDCYGNTILLQELKEKMAGFSTLTEEAEEAMMIVIHNLKRKINDLSNAIGLMEWIPYSKYGVDKDKKIEVTEMYEIGQH